MFRSLIMSGVMVLAAAGTTFAAHPLITDDTGTQGKGKFQLEINGQYGWDDNDGIIQHTTPTASTITYGVIDTVDIAIGIPYLYIKTRDSGTTTQVNGFADVAFSAKWRFYEKDGMSFALKPTLTIPTGDERKQLGTGKAAYSLFFITTKEIKPLAFHLNLGYIANENRIDQRVNLWHMSVATEYRIANNLSAVGNIGIQRNTEKGSSANPAFLLGGLVYSLSKHVDIDAGYKYGLTKPEVDHTVMAGLTFRF